MFPESFDSKELQCLRPVMDGSEPVMTSGNFAVVFKMQNPKTGETFALKCFTQDQDGRAEACRQIETELRYVDSPYFINLHYEEGFASGEFDVSEPAYVFACSDALSHYIMMMYAVANGEEIPIAEDKNGNIIAMARRMKVDFEKGVLKPLFNALRTDTLPAHCRSKYRKGLLALDDYSLARLL